MGNAGRSDSGGGAKFQPMAAHAHRVPGRNGAADGDLK